MLMYPHIEQIDLWAGFPCVDLSMGQGIAAKSGGCSIWFAPRGLEGAGADSTGLWAKVQGVLLCGKCLVNGQVSRRGD